MRLRLEFNSDSAVTGKKPSHKQRLSSASHILRLPSDTAKGSIGNRISDWHTANLGYFCVADKSLSQGNSLLEAEFSSRVDSKNKETSTEEHDGHPSTSLIGYKHQQRFSLQ